MTTIAISHEEIAADSYAYFGDTRASTTRQKIKVSGGKIFAFCGSSQIFDAVMNWYDAGAKPDDVPKHGDWNLIVVTAKGCFFCSPDMPYMGNVDLPCAFGTGERFAYGALDSGMSARDAVRAAMLRDPYTGGEITVVRFADVFYHDLAEAAE